MNTLPPNPRLCGFLIISAYLRTSFHVTNVWPVIAERCGDAAQTFARHANGVQAATGADNYAAVGTANPVGQGHIYPIVAG